MRKKRKTRTKTKKTQNFLPVLPMNMQPFILLHTLPPSLPIHTYTKMIHCEKRKIKHRFIFYLYLKEVKLIKKTELEPYSNLLTVYCIITKDFV